MTGGVLGRAWRERLPLTLAMLGVLGVLVALGTWQMQRRAWKEGLIAAIAERVTAEPITIERVLEIARAGGDIEYRRVRVAGRFRNGEERHLYALERGIAGWHVLTPFETAGQRVVLVNRGFVPVPLKEQSRRHASLIEGQTTLTGLVRVPAADKPAFAPDHNRQRNEWFWTDLPAMLAAVPPPARLPFVIEAELDPARDPPRGGATRLVLSNRHLEYALTWYGLAAALLYVYVAILFNPKNSQEKT